MRKSDGLLSRPPTGSALVHRIAEGVTDILTAAARSALMSRIRGRDTKPEITVRRLLHALGYRFRLHVADLPGRPDIVLPRYKAVILVHGCFWHRHGCQWTYVPKTRQRFWRRKFDANEARDRKVVRALRSAGWRVLTVWECQLTPNSIEGLTVRIRRFLEPAPAPDRQRQR